MAGTKEGGLKAKAKNYELHGSDFYARIGAIGGKNGVLKSVECEEVESKPYDNNAKYTVMSDGTIILQNGKVARLQKDTKGYLRWQAHIDGKVITEKVHRVIARHFIPNPKGLPQVNHKDGDKTNNKVDNLEWCTNEENIRHAIKNGLQDNTNKSMNRLGGQIATAIMSGYIVKDIAKKNGVSEKTIRRRVWEFRPEPITDLKLGRKRKFYYYDGSRNKYRVEATELYKGASFDTAEQAREYIESHQTAGGFAANPELAKIAGKKGGANGKRKGMTEQTKALIETAKKLNSEGKTLTQIAKAIGRSKSRVMAYLKTEAR